MTGEHEFCCGAGEQFMHQAEAVLWDHVQTDNDEAADLAASLLTALLPTVLAYGDARAAEALLSAPPWMVGDDYAEGYVDAKNMAARRIRGRDGMSTTDRTDAPDAEFAARFGRLIAADAADETNRRLHEFAGWVVALDDDDPDSPGRQERRTVTLAAIVDRARAALGGAS